MFASGLGALNFRASREGRLDSDHACSHEQYIRLAHCSRTSESMGSSHSSTRATRVNFAPTPVQVQVHSDAKGTDDEPISLRDLIETKCPSLFAEFRPAWYLFKLVFLSFYPIIMLIDFIKWTPTNYVLRCG